MKAKSLPICRQNQVDCTARQKLGFVLGGSKRDRSVRSLGRMSFKVVRRMARRNTLARQRSAFLSVNIKEDAGHVDREALSGLSSYYLPNR